MCTSAASAVGTVGSYIRLSPMSVATGASTQMSDPTPVLNAASATKPRWALQPCPLASDSPLIGSPLPWPDSFLVPAPALPCHPLATTHSFRHLKN